MTDIFTQMRENIGDLEAFVNEFRKRNAELKQQVDSLQNVNTLLSGDRDRLEKKVFQLQAEVHRLEQDLATFEGLSGKTDKTDFLRR